MQKEDIYQDLLNAYFIIFMDNFGAGKSLSSTYLNLLMAYFNNRKIMLSNTPMYNLSSYNIEFIPLISTSQLTEDLKNVQINLDELQKIANSRDSKSARNSFVTEFSTDIRKFNQGIGSTTQYGNTIDVRLFDNADVIIVPEFKYKLAKRQERKNFVSYWNILFKNEGINETIILDLEILKSFYDTTFKPFKIVVNHNEYLEKLKDNKSQSFYDDYILRCDKEIDKITKIFNLQMKGKI
jgi:hypothetical protein